MTSLPPVRQTEDGAAEWTSCLDRFAAHLTVQQEALRAGRLEDIVVFPAPDSLPPLPASLTARAVRLLALTQELEAQLRVAQQAVGRQLQLARRMDLAGPAGASFLQHHA